MPAKLVHTGKDSPYDLYNWDAYTYRPPYPASTTQLILDYHDQHSKSRGLHHDIGSGNGVYAATLAPHFDHVHASDPSVKNVENIAKRLHVLPGSTTFSTSVGGAENALEALESIPQAKRGQGVDVITVMEALHWVVDTEQAAAAMSNSLSPGGTLAVVYYGPNCHIVNNDAANNILNEMFAQLGRQSIAQKTPHVERGFLQKSRGLDFFALPAHLYDKAKTRRVRINTKGLEQPFWHLGDDWEGAVSQVTSDERVEEYSDGDPLADGWSMEVASDWWAGYINSMADVEMIDAEPYLQRLKEALGDQKARIVFSVSIILATKAS